MKNTFGNLIQTTIFGESHGHTIGVVLDGLPAGIALDEAHIAQQMEKRKAKGRISTQRVEVDDVHIVSGYFRGFTTGTALTILIENTNVQSKDYEASKHVLRPSHADYSAHEKYLGYQDYRGGGHFSGRLSAPLVAAGAIALQILKSKGILIASHIAQCKDLKDQSFSHDIQVLEEQLHKMNDKDFAVLDETIETRMIALIEDCAAQGDSVGGILESCILHIPPGVGEPFFDSIESTLSHLLFSIPAIKGVEFGLGFDFATRYGSEANDSFMYSDRIYTKTNHNGGINGGISNGMPIRLRCVVKPTASIYKMQESIRMDTHESIKLQIQGRHDPAIIHRARVVVDSVLALGILDLIMQREAVLAIQGKEINI